jgi:hypothetical protein
MHLPTVLDRLFLPMASGRRPRRRLTPAVRALEGRQLLSASPAGNLLPSATMIQSATFPNIKSLPNLADQAFLYFSPTMGTLTEVDLVTTGPCSGTINYPGTSGMGFTPPASSSGAQTTVLTSSADLAAFTGSFRMPISVTGQVAGSATSSNTQASETLTVIYYYIPNLPNLNSTSNTSLSTQPSSVPGSGNVAATASTPVSSSTSPANAAPAAPTGTVRVVQALPAKPQHSSTHARVKKPLHAAVVTHKSAHHPLGGHLRPRLVGHSSGVKIHRIDNN